MFKNHIIHITAKSYSDIQDIISWDVQKILASDLNCPVVPSPWHPANWKLDQAFLAETCRILTNSRRGSHPRPPGHCHPHLQFQFAPYQAPLSQNQGRRPSATTIWKDIRSLSMQCWWHSNEKASHRKQEGEWESQNETIPSPIPLVTLKQSLESWVLHRKVSSDLALIGGQNLSPSCKTFCQTWAFQLLIQSVWVFIAEWCTIFFFPFACWIRSSPSAERILQASDSSLGCVHLIVTATDTLIWSIHKHNIGQTASSLRFASPNRSVSNEPWRHFSIRRIIQFYGHSNSAESGKRKPWNEDKSRTTIHNIGISEGDFLLEISLRRSFFDPSTGSSRPPQLNRIDHYQEVTLPRSISEEPSVSSSANSDDIIWDISLGSNTDPNSFRSLLMSKSTSSGSPRSPSLLHKNTTDAG